MESSQPSSSLPHSYEDDLKGLFPSQHPPLPLATPNPLDHSSEITALKKLLSDQAKDFEAEKFKLMHDFTVKLREEERYRIDLLSKIAELEGIRLALEKDLFEGTMGSSRLQGKQAESEENREEMMALRDENARLRTELQQRIEALATIRDSESRLETEHLRTQIRLLELEVSSKQDDHLRLQKTLSSSQQEAKKLREEIGKLEREVGECRRDRAEIEQENADLRQETARLNAESNRLLQKMQSFAETDRPDYASLQMRLEDTTLRIRNLEEMLLQTSENYEEIRQHASLQGEMKRNRVRNSSKGERKRSKSKGSSRNVLISIGNEKSKKGKRKESSQKGTSGL
jgi:hypothetical protein